MTNIYTLFIILTFSTQAFSQSDSLRDYRWQIGASSNRDYLDYGGTDFNFFESPVELNYKFRDLNFSITNASICNTEVNYCFIQTVFEFVIDLEIRLQMEMD